VIVADKKPLSELFENVEGCKRILVAGCKSCVAICLVEERRRWGCWPNPFACSLI